MEKTVIYGVGEQSFEVMRERGCLYVDKTRFIEKIIGSGGQYYFLGRPRRFGKSLFISTLKCFFQGRRDLFKGLYADTMDWDWRPRPVLHIDLNIEKYQRDTDLKEVVESMLRAWEKEYDVTPMSDNISVRFREIIESAYKKTGERVVILIDEYDKPLVSNLHNNGMFEYYRDELASLYSNFKSSAEYIRMVFLTGVSRFAHLSVFSGLNNIRDISFSDQFNDICGISEDELIQNFKEGIHELAEKYGKSDSDIRKELKSRYDGYRFSGNGKDIYNPYSIVNVMEEKEFRNYWMHSGQATLLLEQLKRFNVALEDIIHTKCSLNALIGLDLSNPSPLALLYQTGYLTIKDYDSRRDIYTLGIPNREVEEGFFSYLLPFYAHVSKGDSMLLVYRLIDELDCGDAEGFMNDLKGMFASVSYEMQMEKEQNLHNALLILMKLLSLEVSTEYHTSNGRIDLFISTKQYYYIIEIKLDRSAREAIEQINSKDYALPFKTDGKTIIKIGVNFSTKSRTLSDWIVEQ